MHNINAMSSQQALNAGPRGGLLNNALLVAATLLRFVGLAISDEPTARHLYEIYSVLLSVFTIFSALRLLPLVSRVSRPFGVLVLAIQEMLTSVQMYILVSRRLPPIDLPTARQSKAIQASKHRAGSPSIDTIPVHLFQDYCTPTAQLYPS